MAIEDEALWQERELDETLLGVNALDPFVGTVSAARGAMFANHLGQAPIIEGNEPRRVMAGSEIRYAEHTFDVRIPENAHILHIFRKYPTGIGRDAIKSNPVTTIIFEHDDDEYKTIDAVHVPEYMSHHQDFGYRLVRNKEAWENLHQYGYVGKGTVLAQSTAVKPNGLYGMGVNLETAFMSIPGTIEDGFIISESALAKVAPRTYTEVTANTGRKAYFLNMYGDDTHYKPFPDIGEKIRPDGVIYAIRDHDDDLAPANMTPRALREIDRTFDRVAIGEPGSTVVDIDVFRDNRVNPSYTPTGMDGQLMKYYQAECAYYADVIQVCNTIKSKRREKFRFTPAFNRLVVEAQIHAPSHEPRKLTRMYRLDPLDEWRVSITFETIKKPSNAYKLTDFFGGKGVICKIFKDEDMPVDQWGNRAELVIYGGSTIRRANYGRLYEHGWNAAARDLVQRIAIEAGFDRHHKFTKQDANMAVSNQAFVEWAFQECLDLYDILAPTMKGMVEEEAHHKNAYIHSVLMGGHFLYCPVNDKTRLMPAVNRLLASRFRPNYGKVTYRDQGGTVVTTYNDVLIGKLYIMGLEKIGEDRSAVASVEVQGFGLPSKLSKNDRASTPIRESAIRSYGESETRSYISTCGPEPTVELLDQTNNPEAHRAVIRSILQAEKPSAIARAVNREEVPYGGSRPVGLLQHLMECRGLRFRYSKSI